MCRCCFRRSNASAIKLLQIPSALELIQQLRLQFDPTRAISKIIPRNQEGVLNTFPKGGNLRRMQIGAMRREGHGDGVEQTGAVGSADGEDEVRAFFIRLDGNDRLDREVLDLRCV